MEKKCENCQYFKILDDSKICEIIREGYTEWFEHPFIFQTDKLTNCSYFKPEDKEK